MADVTRAKDWSKVKGLGGGRRQWWDVKFDASLVEGS